MIVTFIGTGCGVPSIERGSSSILVNVEDNLLWFDTGAGSLSRLKEAGFSYKDIDYIFYTHLHLDHIGDLPAFLFASKYSLDLRYKELTIVGSSGLANFYNGLIKLYGKQIDELAYKVNITEVNSVKNAGCLLIGQEGLELSWIKTMHTKESIGYKLKGSAGKTIVYTGDTEYFDDLIDFASEVDLLIIECSFPEQVSGHLNPDRVSEIASKSKVRQVALTHLYPVCNAEDFLSIIAKKFDGKVIIPHDNMSIAL